jgi:hypothetical protein
MSQKITLPGCISPVQAVALEALAAGATVTEAAQKAGVTRETVSRWTHHDPVFIAELQNVRAELALQARCALEALGTQAIAVLLAALQNKPVTPAALRAASIVLKLLGADRGQPIVEPTTPEEVLLRLLEREQKNQERQAKLDAKQSETNAQAAAVAPEPEPAVAEEVTTRAQVLPAAPSEPAGEAVAKWAVGSGQRAEAAVGRQDSAVGRTFLSDHDGQECPSHGGIDSAGPSFQSMPIPQLPL